MNRICGIRLFPCLLLTATTLMANAQTFTQVSASWKSSTPGSVHLSWLGSAPGSEDDPIDATTQSWFQDHPVLSVGNVSQSFFQPSATYHGTDTIIQRAYNYLPAGGQLTGTVSFWGPGVPGSASGLSEPRELVFAGEHGYIQCSLTNPGSNLVTVLNGNFISNGSWVAGNSTQPLTVPAHGSGTYLIPFTVALNAPPGYYGGNLALQVTSNLGTNQIVMPNIIPVGTIVSHHETITPSGSFSSFFDVFLDVQSPAGFEESVESKGSMTWKIGTDKSVQVQETTSEYDATVTLPNNYQNQQTFWNTNQSPQVPTNYKVTSSSWGRTIFRLATAAIMAAARVAGAQATKALLAAASQLLGPEVGVPVTLVLYSPAMEAWWNWLMGGSGALGGAALNGKIYDKIFG